MRTPTTAEPPSRRRPSRWDRPAGARTASDRGGRGPGWLVAAGVGRRLELAGCDCLIKVENAEAAGGYSVIEVGLPAEPPSTLIHADYEFDESYFIVEGDVLADVGGERSRVHRGAMVTVPAGVSHTVAAAGRRPARCPLHHPARRPL